MAASAAAPRPRVGWGVRVFILKQKRGCEFQMFR